MAISSINLKIIGLSGIALEVTMSTFDSHGIQFDYPNEWQLSEETEEGQTTISLESPRSAFWMLMIVAGRPAAEDVLASALGSFQEEHPSADAYEVEEQICMLPTIGVDIDFESAEMINRAAFRICETDNVTLFVVHQCPQTEEAEFGNELKSITSSLMWDTEDDDGFDPYAYDNLTGLQP